MIWQGLWDKSLCLKRALPEAFWLSLEEPFGMVLGGSGLSTLTLGQKKSLWVDLFYAFLNHHHWLRMELLGQSVVAFLKSDHGIPEDNARVLFDGLSGLWLSHREPDPYWEEPWDQKNFVCYILCSLLSHGGTHRIGLGNDLLHLIRDSISTPSQNSLPHSLGEWIETFSQEIQADPMALPGYRLKFILEPVLPQDWRDYFLERGFRGLLPCLKAKAPLSRSAFSSLTPCPAIESLLDTAEKTGLLFQIKEKKTPHWYLDPKYEIK